jgi:nucleoside-diphosphate-sugar epimerase
MKKIAKPRILIVGCGDIGMRLLPFLLPKFRVFALTSHSERCDVLRAAGAIPVVADLDQTDSLARLRGLAKTVIHLAPSQSEGVIDRRTRRLVAILPDAARVVYVSTSGVYGDCGGAEIDETRPVRPHNARAKRRVDAEEILRSWARRASGHLSILRVPGIYADDRLPIERLQRKSPALIPEDDVYTNHIHADDLARIVSLTVFRGSPNRVYNTVDNSDMKMADYFDLVADARGMDRPPRMPRGELKDVVSPMLLSFMSESRRLSNTRLLRELGVRLTYPTVADGLKNSASAIPLPAREV